MSQARRVVILGSTGSIGRQTLEVAERFPDRIRVVALAAWGNATLLAEQAQRHGAPHVALANPERVGVLSSLMPNATVGAGPNAVEEMAANPDADIVVNALVGAAGLRATLAALRSGKRLALANKESLVVGGPLVTRAADPGTLIPVDSEHSALFQCLLGESSANLVRVWLTASGGPFLGASRAQLASATVEEALAHPRWSMGPKITIDSATLMNKGLEAIEAHFLFGIGYDDIRVVVHPQSCVHSMAEFTDSSVKAHLGATDMRIPIQYALSHPDRWEAPVEPVDFGAIGSLDFEEPDVKTFRCLALALDAGREGGTMPAAMNAANEIAVEAFLAGRCSLVEIDEVVAAVMDAHEKAPADTVEAIEAADAWARTTARRALAL